MLGVVDVLELAAAAATEVLAARLDALRRGLEDEHGGGLDEPRRVVRDLGDHALARQGVLDEDDATVLGVADGAAARCEAVERELDRFEGPVVASPIALVAARRDRLRCERRRSGSVATGWS